VTLRQPPPAKEKQPTPPPAPPKQTAQQAQEELLLHIENLKEPRTRRKYSDIFMDAPSKKQYPEYYEFIERVICLNEIKVWRCSELGADLAEECKEGSIQVLGRV